MSLVAENVFDQKTSIYLSIGCDQLAFCSYVSWNGNFFMRLRYKFSNFESRIEFLAPRIASIIFVEGLSVQYQKPELITQNNFNFGL